MNYTKKHKDLIVKLFKKVGMLKEAKIVLSCDEYKYDIGKAMRDAASKTKTGIGANLALLDAARRYETRECAIFKECTLPHCEGRSMVRYLQPWRKPWVYWYCLSSFG